MNEKQREHIMGHRIKGKMYARVFLNNEKLIEACIEVEANLVVL